VPTVGALDNPASWFSPNATHQRRLASAPNVRLHVTVAGLLLAVLVVVTLVQAKMLGQQRPAAVLKGDGVQRGTDHPFVVGVGAGQRDGQGNTVPVGQNMPFGAEFSAIGGIGARDVPPLGAFTEALSSDAHSRSSPTFSW